MTLKAIGVSLIILLSSSIVSSVHAAPPPDENMCDGMIEKGTFSDSQIQDCLEDQGKSKKYLANKAAIEAKRLAEKEKEEKEADAEAKKEKKDAEEKAAQKAKDAAIEKNIESKEFTEKELSKKSYGGGFFAFKVDYSKPTKPKRKKLTPGDALCSFLGFDKAISGSYTEETANSIKIKPGFIIPKRFLLGADKIPTPYNDRDDTPGKAYLTIKWETIKCAKLAKNIPQEIEEDTIAKFDGMKFQEIGKAPEKDLEEDEEISVDSSGRGSQKEEKKKKNNQQPATNTPNGYVRPGHDAQK
ncbi:MAG: hypothetical protein K2Q18_11355 [Bdellovibrionales bacterium]|nr:hypothetical protein [Bdellovibrionales bacterium]